MDGFLALQALLYLSYITSAILAVFLLWSGRRFPGAWFWITGQAFVAAGAILDLTPTGFPDWIPLVVANGLYIASCSLYFHAIWKFRFGTRVPSWVFLWIPVEVLCFLVVRQEPYLVRATVFAFWLSLGAGVNGVLLLWKPAPKERSTLALAASPFLVLSLACAIRLVMLTVLASRLEPDPDPINLVYVMSNILLATFLLFAYFMLSHLHTDRLARQSANTPADPELPLPDLAVPTAPSWSEFGISPREAEVARLVTEGLSSKDIADRLFISPGTVKNHLKSLFRKTGSQNRADLVRRLLVGEKRLSQA